MTRMYPNTVSGGFAQYDGDHRRVNPYDSETEEDSEDKGERRRVVSKHVFNPATSIFKQSKNEKAVYTTILCKLESCPLRDAGACMLRPLFGSTQCPYGRVRKETGPTRRAQKFSKWIRDRQDEYPGVPTLGYPKTRMAIVGEYVYLPYAHMTLCSPVPFLSHGGFMSSGTCLLPLVNWSVENVERLVVFRPQAMMGGEITKYQSEQVPLFLLHLRECDDRMWQQLITARPELDVEPNHVGRKAFLKTLRSPIHWGTKHANYPVQWEWNGREVVTQSLDAYDRTWGKMKVASVEIRAIPADDAEIEVQDNAWVTSETVFTT